jgi:hypothetical protein
MGRQVRLGVDIDTPRECRASRIGTPAFVREE